MSKACAQRLLHVPSLQAEGKLAEPRNSLWLSLLKWLRSVQHYSSQLSFPEGSNEIVSCCCVVWDSDGNVAWVRRGTNIFILRRIFQTNTDAELTLQVFQHRKEILKAHFLTHSSNGFDPLSLSKFYCNAFEDVLDVIARLLEVIFLHITAHRDTRTYSKQSQ